MREFRIFGMRRSGNHAIIEWIAAHFSKTIHHNDCWGWETVKHNSLHTYGNVESETDCKIISYEDFCPSITEIKDPRTVVILRDWFNMMSSRIVTKRLGVRKGHEQHCSSDKVLQTWLKYADAHKDNPDKFILYNKWVGDPDYRSKIQERLGLDNSKDRYTAEFPKSNIGKGSSFNEGELNLFVVNKRYKMLKLYVPEVYESLNFKKANDLCKEIFGLNPFENLSSH